MSELSDMNSVTKAGVDGDNSDGPAQSRVASSLDERHAADLSGTTPRGRTRVYPTFHSCARGSGYPCLMVISALDESSDRGDASWLHRGG